MQLKLSLAASALIVSTLNAEDYVSLQFMQYDENDNKVSVSAPSIEVNKDFGTDYTLNLQMVADAVSGASPTYYDGDTGASAYSRGATTNPQYDNIDFDDNRIAFDTLFTMRFESRDELTLGLGYSTESDWYSYNASTDYLHWLGENKNQSLSFGLSVQLNEILINDCATNSECDASSGASEAETNSLINTEVGFTQIIDKDSYAKVALFYITESGYLSSPYHNVLIDNGGGNYTIQNEVRPDDRSAYGTSLSYTRSINENLSLLSDYRYYSDDWGINSHTIGFSGFYTYDSLTFNAGLRYYMQSEADFYSADALPNTTPYGDIASSDERLSDFNSLEYEAGVDWRLDKEWSLNFNAGFYDQSTNLSAVYFITGVKYRF